MEATEELRGEMMKTNTVGVAEKGKRTDSRIFVEVRLIDCSGYLKDELNRFVLGDLEEYIWGQELMPCMMMALNLILSMAYFCKHHKNLTYTNISIYMYIYAWYT